MEYFYGVISKIGLWNKVAMLMTLLFTFSRLEIYFYTVWNEISWQANQTLQNWLYFDQRSKIWIRKFLFLLYALFNLDKTLILKVNINIPQKKSKQLVKKIFFWKLRNFSFKGDSGRIPHFIPNPAAEFRVLGHTQFVLHL